MTSICEYCQNFKPISESDAKNKENCKDFEEKENSCANFNLIFNIEYPEDLFVELINNQNFDKSFELILSNILKGYADKKIFSLMLDLANATLTVKNLASGVESKPIKVKEVSMDYEKEMNLTLSKEMNLEFNVTGFSSNNKNKPIIAFLHLVGSDSIYQINSIKIPLFLRGKVMLKYEKIKK